jgi:hypothetical protein
LQANEQEISWMKRSKCLFTAREKKVPRPKTELTKSGKTIGVRVTASEYEEWIKIGGSKWLRMQLQQSRDNRLNVPKPKTT